MNCGSELRLAIGAVIAATVSACATHGDMSRATTGPSIGLEQAEPSVSRPEIKIGDSWTYRQKDLLTGRLISSTVISVANVTPRAIQTLTIGRRREGPRRHMHVR